MAIVCSGNGVQALWKLKEPVSVELAERANLAILWKSLAAIRAHMTAQGC